MTMSNRAVVQTRFPGEGEASLELVERPVPTASAGTVVIRLTTRSVNPNDLTNIRDNKLQSFHDEHHPIIGSEGCGRIFQVLSETPVLLSGDLRARIASPFPPSRVLSFGIVRLNSPHLSGRKITATITLKTASRKTGHTSVLSWMFGAIFRNQCCFRNLCSISVGTTDVFLCHVNL